MAKNIASFEPLSDSLSASVIKADIEKIADLRGFIGKSRVGHKTHNAAIYAGTENLVAHVGDGAIVQGNADKKVIVVRKKNVTDVIAFSIAQIKEIASKFPEEEYAWSMKGTVQMTTKRVDLLKPIHVTFRPKARTYKELGVSGDVSSVERIDRQFYSFIPEMQPEGLKIQIKKK